MMHTVPRHRAAWLASIAACGLPWVSGAVAAEPPPPTVAIVPTAAARAPLADLLTADLSRDAGLRLVERQAVARVVDELKLAAAGDPAAGVKLGQLLAADAIVMLDAGSAETPPRVRVRMVETRTGIRLADGEWAAADLLADRAVLLADLRTGLRKLRAAAESRRLVGIVGLRSEEETGSTMATARALTVFAAQDLQRLPDVVVLEREQLRRLTTERDLTGTELDLRTSALLLEGSLRREGDTFVIALALLPLKDGKRRERTVTTPAKTGAARDAIAAALADMLAAAVEPETASPTAEAKLLLERARRLDRIGDGTQASRLAEAAYVLHPCRETFDLANALSRAALPADASPVDVAQAGLRQAELIGDFYERTTESLAWETLFPVELLHSIWSPTPAPASAEEAEIRDRIRAVERATADRVLAFRRAAERPTTGFVLVRQLALIDQLVPGAPHPTAADFMRSVTGLQRELATEALADRLPNGPGFTVWQKDAGVVIAREAFANQYHTAMLMAVMDRPARPPLAEIAPLVDGLVGGSDPAVQIIGLSCLLNQPGARSLTAAERILDIYFRKADPPWTFFEMAAYKTVAQIAAVALQRLAFEGRATAYVEALVATAEQSDDGGLLMRSPELFAHAVIMTEGRAGGLHRRVETLLKARTYSRDTRSQIARYRRIIGERFNPQAGKGDGAPPPPPPVGPWADYVIEPVTFTNAPPDHPRLVAAAVDRQAADQGSSILLLWAAAAPKGGGPGAPLAWPHLLTRCGPGGGLLTEVAAFDLPTEGITWLAAGDGRAFIGTFGHGLFVVDGRGLTAVGEKDGLPSNSIGRMAWLDGRLYMAVPRGLATYAPDTGAATFASAAAVVPRHQLDGGEPYEITGMLADPVRHRLWLAVGGDRSRSGLWCHSLRDGGWRRVLMGSVRGLFWDGGRKALANWTLYSRVPYEIDLDDCGHVPLLGFVTAEQTFVPEVLAGMAVLDGHLFAGPGRLLDTDGVWYQPQPDSLRWTNIERLGDTLVTFNLHENAVSRIRRRGAAPPSRTPADAEAAMHGDAKLRAAVAALGADTPPARLAGLKAYQERRAAIDWLLCENRPQFRCHGDEAFARILLDNSRPTEQLAAIDVIRRLDALRMVDAKVLHRLAADGPPQVAAAARSQLSRFGSTYTYLVEYPEVDTHSPDPLKRAAAVAEIGRQALVVPAALPVLVRMLDDEVDFVALAAVAELDPYGDEPLPAILDAAARAAGRGDVRRAARMLARRLDPPPDAAIDAAASITWMGERLAELARSPNAALAAAAGRARAACEAIAKQSAAPAGGGR